MSNVSYVLLVGAGVCFLLGAFNVVVPRISTVALGLALWVLSILIK